MRTKNLVKISSYAFLALLFIASCGKRRQANEAVEMSQQSNTAEAATLDFQVMGEEASRGPVSFQTYQASCATLSYDTTGMNVKITVDYGTTNCMCADGKNRRGKIFIAYNGTGFYTVGNTVTFTTSQYYVNDNQIEGTRTVKHPDQDKWTIDAEATITFADNAGTATWKSNRTRIQTQGQATPLILADNVYEITGTASGITAQGRGYDITITSPLQIQLNCRYIQSGKLEINSSGLKEAAVVDYGDGTCDAKATLTYRGKIKDLNL